MIALSSSFSSWFCTKELGISNTEMSRPYLGQMISVRRTDSSAEVGDVASSFGILPRCLFSPETMRPLMVAPFFPLRNRCDSRTWSYS